MGVVWKREMNARRDRTCKWKGMGERDEDWERAHLRVGVVFGREIPTGRERT